MTRRLLRREVDRPSPSSGVYARSPIRKVLRRPHAVLASRAAEVDPCDPAVVALADALVATMRASPACVGLAATQVGEALRLFCMDVTGHKNAESCAGLVVLANPRIIARSELSVMREGCMSVPDLTGNVTRAAKVVVEGLEAGTGSVIRVTADAIEARCLQHEIDHLDGTLFVDRVSDPSRDLFTRKSYAKEPMFLALKQSLAESIEDAIADMCHGETEPRTVAELAALAAEAEDAESAAELESIAERVERVLDARGAGTYAR